MTADQFRALALAFPETVEAPHFDRTSFRAGKKIFATLVPDGTEAMVKVPDPHEVQRLLDEHDGVCFSYGKWTESMGCLGLRLRKVKKDLVHPLLVEAWRSVATKRALRAYDGNLH